MISFKVISGITAHYLKFQTSMIKKLVWPYSFYEDDLVRWRAMILFSILFAGLALGLFAFAISLIAIINEGIWGMAIADIIGLSLGLLLLRAPKIKFEIRASITCLIFFLIGVTVITSIGPQIGGPAWLFAFSVLSGVLLGNWAAFGAILLNTLFLVTICLLMLNGNYEFNMPFFSSPKDMTASVSNFIIVNAITAISVSALVKGVFEIYNQKKKITKDLQKEQKDLLLIKKTLEREIVERNRAEGELLVKNLVFESAITANSISDAQSHLTTVNNTFLKLWGCDSKKDVLGKSIAQFFKFQHEAEAVVASLDGTSVWEGEFTALKKDGSTFDAYALATTIQDSSENITGYQSSVIDISGRKKAENEKIEAQKIAGEQDKLALVGQIAGKMAHDFNNVLGIIMGHTELALLKYNELEIKNTFELIFNQTLRGKNLTKNLIAFAKSSEPKQEFFSINEKINFVLHLLKNDLGGIKIVKDESEIFEVLADPGMIEHSLVNLIQNSIHALGLTENPKIIIRIFHMGKTIAIEIEDNGCGIPEEHIDNIYEPSFSLKGGQDIHGRYQDGIKGTGYGMANVKKYIQLHRGNIFVESKLDTRTKVTITLPKIEKELTDDEVLEIQGVNNYSGKNILLVEDEPAISEVQYHILTQAPVKHEVDIAPNGQTAIEMFKKNQYDLISLDYMLPGKTNGIDIYRHIRKTNISVPILFVSGNIEFLESINLLKQKDPFLAHLSKPCMNVDYLNSMNKLFELTT